MKRGRPQNSADETIAAADETIGRTAHTLVMWGFPARRRVYPVVAKIAHELLGRTDHAGLALSADRVEQICEAWTGRATERAEGWILSDGTRALTPRASVSKASLQEGRPNKQASLEVLARTLIRNRGTWPRNANAVRVWHGDAIPTKKVRELAALYPSPKFKRE